MKWECIDRLMWGYRVSCVVTIVTKNRSVGIDVFIEESCVYASTWGLEDGPVRPCDVIPVYVWMRRFQVRGIVFPTYPRKRQASL